MIYQYKYLQDKIKISIFATINQSSLNHCIWIENRAPVLVVETMEIYL
jgi:hypothetical protein